MPEKFFFSLSSQSIEAVIFLNLSPKDKTQHHNTWLFQPSPASMLNNLIVPGSRSKIENTEQKMEPKCLWCLGQVQVSNMWIWLDRAKWQLEWTEPASLPSKNLMFLESQTSQWADMDPKTGCNKMRSAERYWPSLGVYKADDWLWGPVLGSIPMAFKNVMVRFFLTENVNWHGK